MSRLVGAVAPIALETRSGYDESIHHGAGVAVGPTGQVVAVIGDPNLVVYPRSSLKPLQAQAMCSLGLELRPAQLAIACASHDGAPEHLAAVRSILDAYGLTEADLDNTPARPYGAAARRAARAQGTEPSSIQQNCSGKHAAMLATCVVNGWPTSGYLEPDHPVQAGITAWMQRAGCTVHHIGVDGCGAPTHALALSDLAMTFAALVRGRTNAAAAMTAHPALVAGPSRDVTRWMRAVPGLVAKEGAAGVFAAALPDGRAVAFKIADGSDDARRAVVPAALAALGVDVGAVTSAGIDEALAAARDASRVDVLGHGRPVGSVHALEWTPCAS